MEPLLSDLRYALRELKKRPGFALTAILSLAIGIGATSAVFSVIYAVLIDPFPYPGSNRLMEIRLIDKAGHERGAGYSGPQLEQLGQAKSVESVVAMDGWNLTTTDGDVPEDVQAYYFVSERSESLGNSCAQRPLADSFRRAVWPGTATRGRSPLSVLAKVLHGRSRRCGPQDPVGSQELRNRRRNAAAIQMGRSRLVYASQGDGRPEHI